jgi:hypothetical protein
MEPLLIELIQGDFLIYKKTSVKAQNKHTISNPQEILLELKQQIKVFKKIQSIGNFKICLYVEDHYIKDMLQLTQEEIKNDRIVVCGSSEISYLKKSHNKNIVVVIGTINNNVKKFFIDNNIFIISILDIRSNFSYDGLYRVKNSFKSLKKVVWFISLLDLAIKN